MIRPALVISLLAAMSVAAAPNAKVLGEPIVDIRVEGLRRVEPEAALSKSQLKAGEAYDEAKLTTALRQVWETELFRDVRVEREHVEGGWRIIFVVAEKPSIKEVKYEGRDDLSEDDIKAVVDVKPFTILKID